MLAVLVISFSKLTGNPSTQVLCVIEFLHLVVLRLEEGLPFDIFVAGFELGFLFEEEGELAVVGWVPS